VTGNAELIVCTGQGTHPAVAAEGQPHPGFDFAQQLFALYARRRRRTPGRPPRGREHITDGTMSLGQLAAQHGTTPAAILRLTAENNTPPADAHVTTKGPSPVTSHIEWRCPACGRVMRRGGRLMDRLVNVVFSDDAKAGDRADISYDPPRWV
jgi:hypothetical protein